MNVFNVATGEDASGADPRDVALDDYRARNLQSGSESWPKTTADQVSTNVHRADSRETSDGAAFGADASKERTRDADILNGTCRSDHAGAGTGAATEIDADFRVGD